MSRGPSFWKKIRGAFRVLTLSMALSGLGWPTVFAGPSASLPEIPDGKTVIVIGQNNKTIHEYIKAMKHVPAGFMLYTGIHDMEGLDAWSRDHGAGRFHGSELAGKYPGCILQVGLYMVDSLEKTVRGTFDKNLHKLASWLKAVSSPVYLRIGYEFDGHHNHYDPEAYKKAYVYVVEFLRKAGVRNTAYVWHSFSNDIEDPIANWYPGDAYVDWVGISYFDQPEEYMIPVVEFAKARGLPIMVAEATPKGMGTPKGENTWIFWFKPLFRFVAAHDIKMISYINSNWEAMPMWQGMDWRDARIQANPFIKQHWIEEMKKDRYLTTIEELPAPIP